MDELDDLDLSEILGSNVTHEEVPPVSTDLRISTITAICKTNVSINLSNLVGELEEFEPKVNKQLYKLKNVVMLPHMGSATKKTRQDMISLACDNVINFLFKNKIDNLVNKEIF